MLLRFSDVFRGYRDKHCSVMIKLFSKKNPSQMFDTVLNAPLNLQQTNCLAIKRFHDWCFLDNILKFFRSTFFSNTRGKLLLENARIPLWEKWPIPKFCSIFSCIRTEYGDLPYKSPFSVRMWGNTDQKKVCNGYFSPSVSFCDKNRKVPEDF